MALAAPTIGHADLPLGEAHEALHALGVTAERPALGEGAQVHAGAEGLVARAGEHHGPDLRVALGLPACRGRWRSSSSGLSALRASGRLSRSTVTAPRRSVTRTGSVFASVSAHQATTFLSRRSAIASAE